MLTGIAVLQMSVYLIVIVLLVKPVGWFIAQVYEGKTPGISRFLKPIELYLYKLCGINPDHSMNWINYLSAMLILNLFSLILSYALLRLQAYLPLNPQHMTGLSPDLAFNTAISFITNTDWQSYAGETTMSYFSQMMSLTTQNFLSASTGLALFIAFARGLAKIERNNLGNFWVDLIRGILYIFLPLSFIFSIILVSQGVIQNLLPNQTVELIQPFHYPDSSELVKQQIIPMGPVASQVAIAQLGTNGGGFYNVNAAHPFANPSPLTNFLEMLAILLIPAASCYTFGLMVHDKRQGWAILITMLIFFIPYALMAIAAEQTTNPGLNSISTKHHVMIDGSHGNMEGKETRFGVTSSALWTTATTATSNGSVNSMLDSYTPLGGWVPLWMMVLGEVIFGGVGTGISGMLILLMISVFISGLMVGRTPEYLGKKIEPFEMKMASIAVLVIPLVILVSTSFALLNKNAINSMGNQGIHGLIEVIYAFTSMGNNNGSSFAGLNANTPFYNILGGLIMLIGRYWIAIPVLAIAGSLVKKKHTPPNSGTLMTHTPIFIIMLISVIYLLGALSYLPAFSQGPIIEHLLLWGGI